MDGNTSANEEKAHVTDDEWRTVCMSIRLHRHTQDGQTKTFVNPADWNPVPGKTNVMQSSSTSSKAPLNSCQLQYSDEKVCVRLTDLSARTVMEARKRYILSNLQFTRVKRGKSLHNFRGGCALSIPDVLKQWRQVQEWIAQDGKLRNEWNTMPAMKSFLKLINEGIIHLDNNEDVEKTLCIARWKQTSRIVGVMMTENNENNEGYVLIHRIGVLQDFHRAGVMEFIWIQYACGFVNGSWNVRLASANCAKEVGPLWARLLCITEYVDPKSTHQARGSKATSVQDEMEKCQATLAVSNTVTIQNTLSLYRGLARYLRTPIYTSLRRLRTIDSAQHECICDDGCNNVLNKKLCIVDNVADIIADRDDRFMPSDWMILHGDAVRPKNPCWPWKKRGAAPSQSQDPMPSRSYVNHESIESSFNDFLQNEVAFCFEYGTEAGTDVVFRSQENRLYRFLDGMRELDLSTVKEFASDNPQGVVWCAGPALPLKLCLIRQCAAGNGIFLAKIAALKNVIEDLDLDIDDIDF